MASACCAAAGKPVVPIEAYTKRGSMHKIQDQDFYIVGSGDRAIILIHDVFGFEFPQVFQVSDLLADGGFVVIAPDVFHGKPWPGSKWPPQPEDNFFEWCAKEAGWEATKPGVEIAYEYLKDKLHVKAFGCLGFCSGAFCSFTAGAVDGWFQAVAGCHPSLFGQDKAIAEAVTVPLAICAAEGDPLETVKEVMDTKPFGSQCFYKRYPDMVHGWMAARGEWDKPEVAAAATDGIGHLITFFKATLIPPKKCLFSILKPGHRKK